MNIGTALRSAGQVLFDRPASVLPVYLLVLGITATTRVPIVVGIAAVLGVLVADGRLQALFEAIESVDLDALEEVGANGELDSDMIPPELETAVVDILSIEILGIVGLAVGFAVVVGIVSNGLSNAAAINGIYGCLYNGDGVTDAVVGVGRDWNAFVGITLVQVAVVVVGLVPLVVGVSVFAVSVAAGVGATLVGGLLSAAIIVGGLLILAFAGQSVVVDGTTLGGAIRQSAGFPFRSPLAFLSYVLVALGVFGGLSVFGGLFAALGVSQLIGIISPLVVIPFLDAFKTALYADRPFGNRSTATQSHTAVADGGSDRTDPVDGEKPAKSEKPADAVDGRESDSVDADGDSHNRTAVEQPTDSSDQLPDNGEQLVDSNDQSVDCPGSDDETSAYRHQIVAAFRDGLRAVGAFTRSQPGSILAATALFAAAAATGWLLTAEFVVDLPAEGGIGEVFGTIPVGTFVMIAANNWLVSATAIYGGVAFGVPTAVDMLLNGFVIGAVAGVVEPIVFLALVAPHGIVEVPAILIAGGLGLHVGWTVFGAFRGRQSAAEVADVLRLAYRVLLGLAIILIIAAFIEAFLTPPIAELVLT